MKRFFHVFSVAATALLLCGCGHTPIDRTVMPAAIPPHQTSAETAQLRGEGLKNVLAAVPIRGAGIYPAAIFGRFSNEQVLDALDANGFNRIYCMLSSEQELDENLAGFVTLAVKRDFKVEVLLSQHNFYRRYRSNRLIRNMLIQFPDLPEAVEKVVKFNQKLPENIRLAGVTAILTPHIFNGANVEMIKGKLYSWNEKNYGIGKDNDMLMREALATAQQIAEIPGLPELTIGLTDFYHDAAVSGKLSCGRISDFAAIAPKVMILTSANLPSKLPGSVIDELAALPAEKQAIISVALAGHTSQNSRVLRRRNWTDFQNSINYLIKKSAVHPAFSGVVISPFSVVEYLRLEK